MDPYSYNYNYAAPTYDYTVGDVPQKGHHSCLWMDIRNPYCFYLKLALLSSIIAITLYLLIVYYCPLDNKSMLGSLFCDLVAFIKGLVWVFDEISSAWSWLSNLL